jgi:hypothetical protein
VKTVLPKAFGRMEVRMLYRVASALVITLLTIPCAAQESEQELEQTPARTQTADPIGDLAFAAGWKFPQGSYDRFADDGFTGWIRGNIKFGESHLVTVLTGLGGTHFATSNEAVAVIADTIAFAAQRTVSNYEFSFHLGPQLGVGNRLGLFRPRVAIAPGIYLFNTQTDVRLVSDTENLTSSTVTQIRFGWRAIGGVDLFFTGKWGVSLDVTYDGVWLLNHTTEDEYGNPTTEEDTGRFLGFLVGVVIPLDQLPD